MGIKVDSKVFERRMKKLSGLPSYLIKDALRIQKKTLLYDQDTHEITQQFKAIRFFLIMLTQAALDSGSSKQAPQRFTEPTIEQLNKDTTKFVRKV
jgi:hypothetical protein